MFASEFQFALSIYRFYTSCSFIFYYSIYVLIFNKNIVNKPSYSIYFISLNRRFPTLVFRAFIRNYPYFFICLYDRISLLWCLCQSFKHRVNFLSKPVKNRIAEGSRKWNSFIVKNQWNIVRKQWDHYKVNRQSF